MAICPLNPPSAVAEIEVIAALPCAMEIEPGLKEKLKSGLGGGGTFWPVGDAELLHPETARTTSNKVVSSPEGGSSVSDHDRSRVMEVLNPQAATDCRQAE
jgi:hypothetical protein